VLILQSMCLTEPTGSRAVEVTDTLAEARAELSTAQRHLQQLDEQTADLAAELGAVITRRRGRDARARQRSRLPAGSVVVRVGVSERSAGPGEFG
jgi:uncharacterized protein (DUF3084 family)